MEQEAKKSEEGRMTALRTGGGGGGGAEEVEGEQSRDARTLTRWPEPFDEAAK